VRDRKGLVLMVETRHASPLGELSKLVYTIKTGATAYPERARL